LAKSDRTGFNLHSTKHDSSERNTQPKSTSDRWCELLQHRFHFSGCSCTDAHSCTLRCQSFPYGWTDCRSNAASPISRFCTDSYSGRRCYAIGDAHTYSVDHICYYSANSNCQRHCYFIVDAPFDDSWRIVDPICSFSGNSKRKRGYYVIDHCCAPDSHSHSRRHAVDRTCQSSAGSYNFADSCTRELCSRSPGYSCFERRCVNLGFGWWFHADSLANAGCAFERYRELPTDDCANRRESPGPIPVSYNFVQPCGRHGAE
jgi:hypothetical protein